MFGTQAVPNKEMHKGPGTMRIYVKHTTLPDPLPFNEVPKDTPFDAFVEMCVRKVGIKGLGVDILLDNTCRAKITAVTDLKDEDVVVLRETDPWEHFRHRVVTEDISFLMQFFGIDKTITEAVDTLIEKRSVVPIGDVFDVNIKGNPDTEGYGDSWNLHIPAHTADVANNLMKDYGTALHMEVCYAEKYDPEDYDPHKPPWNVSFTVTHPRTIALDDISPLMVPRLGIDSRTSTMNKVKWECMTFIYDDLENALKANFGGRKRKHADAN